MRDLGALEREISPPARPLEQSRPLTQETRRLGALLGAALGPGDVVALEGDLGAGKTVFAQGMGSGLGVSDAITSPTFTLIHEYRGRVPFYHVDLYRLSGEAGAGEAEAGVIGLEEYLGGDGVRRRGVVAAGPGAAAPRPPPGAALSGGRCAAAPDSLRRHGAALGGHPGGPRGPPVRSRGAPGARE